MIINAKIEDNDLNCFYFRRRNSVTELLFYVAAYELAIYGYYKQIFVKKSLGFGVFCLSGNILFACCFCWLPK